MDYRIEFLEGHEFRTEPEPWNFTVRTSKEANAEIALALGILPPITERKLHNRGVKRILRGGREIPLKAFGEPS